jgi:hypothetical protein
MARGRDLGQRTSYCIARDSDLVYAREAHRRVAQRSRRRWALRAFVLLLLVMAAYAWGPDLAARLRARAGATRNQLSQVGRHIRSGVDRRTGTDEDYAP